MAIPFYRIVHRAHTHTYARILFSDYRINSIKCVLLCVRLVHTVYPSIFCIYVTWQCFWSQHHRNRLQVNRRNGLFISWIIYISHHTNTHDTPTHQRTVFVWYGRCATAHSHLFICVCVCLRASMVAHVNVFELFAIHIYMFASSFFLVWICAFSFVRLFVSLCSTLVLSLCEWLFSFAHFPCVCFQFFVLFVSLFLCCSFYNSFYNLRGVVDTYVLIPAASICCFDGASTHTNTNTSHTNNIAKLNN